MYWDSKAGADCCGCSACAQICGAHAIEMQMDNNGFYYPAFDAQKCVHCGRCQKVCPTQINLVGQKGNPTIYAAKCNDAQTLFESSSGGVFSILAQWIIEKGGAVYGAEFDEEFHVVHKRETTMEGVAKFRTSKYVESDVFALIPSIMKDLQEGRFVLASGTPCQISSVCRFLDEKGVDRKLLYTCDVVCHGVPSRKVWADYLSILRTKYIQPTDRVVHINMRSKKMHWKKQVLDVQLEKGNIDEVISGFSYNRLYLSTLLHRPSCFDCRYTSFQRVSDFSLCDFWNVDAVKMDVPADGGLNVVLLNTPKAKECFEWLKPSLTCQEIDQKQAWQPHLEYSTKKSAKQEEFWAEYHAAQDKEPVMRKYMEGTALVKLIHAIQPTLQKLGLFSFAGKLYKTIFAKRR